MLLESVLVSFFYKFEQFSQHHLLKRLSFLHCIVLPPLSKIRCPQVCAFYFVPLIYISVFVSVPYCLDCSYVVQSEVRQVDSSNSILLSHGCFQGFLYFHTNFEIICSSSLKNTLGSLIGIALNL